MHYYQFNIADYRKDTVHLSTIEHGIYRQLIDWYYLEEKPIPLETQVVMRRLSLGSDNLHNLQNVLSDFFKETKLGYCHKRITVELENYQAQFAKNRVNGKLGGRPSKTQVVSENNHMATQAEPKITLTNNHKPITNNQINKNLTQKNEFFADIDFDVYQAWLSVRKAKRGGKISKVVYAAVARESLKAGLTIEQAVRECAERNWITFNADWYESSKNKSSGIVNLIRKSKMDISGIDYTHGVNADGSF